MKPESVLISILLCPSGYSSSQSLECKTIGMNLEVCVSVSVTWGGLGPEATVSLQVKFRIHLITK